MRAWGFGLKTALVVLFSFSFAAIGLQFATMAGLASPVWPASGFGLAAVLIGGRSRGIAVFLGAFLANLWVGESPFILAVGLGAANACEAVVGLRVFRYFQRRSESLRPLYNSGRFSVWLGTIFLPPILGATIGISFLWAYSLISVSELFVTFLTWWMGDAMGILIVAPTCLALHSRLRVWKPRLISRQSLTELCLAMTAWILTVWIGYLNFDYYDSPKILVFNFLPLLMAFVWGNSFSILSTSFVTAGSIFFFALLGVRDWSISKDLIFHLQIFILVYAVTALSLCHFHKTKSIRIALLPLIFGWTIAEIGLFVLLSNHEDRISSQLKVKVRSIVNVFDNRITTAEGLLRTAVAFWHSSEKVEPREWASFVDSINMPEHYPGILGLGLVFPVPKHETRRYEEKMKRLLGGSFDVKDVPLDLRVGGRQENHEFEISEKSDRFIISYIEPLDINKPARGLDLGSEMTRRLAAEQARDSGLATMTPRITLAQDEERGPGFLLYFPIYATRSNLDTVEARRRAFVAWAYSPIRVKPILDEFLSEISGQLHFRLLEEDVWGHSSVLIETHSKYLGSSWTPQGTSDFTIAGRSFRAEWARASHLSQFGGAWGFWFAALTSFLMLLLTSLLVITERTKDEAERLANVRTQELREKSALLEEVLEASPIGLTFVSVEGLCRYINPALSRLLNQKLESTSGRFWIDLLQSSDRQKLVDSWNGLLTGSLMHFEISLEHPESRRHLFVLITGTPVVDHDRCHRGYLIGFQDLTALRDQQLRLTETVRLASLGEMAGGIAHEINNPLAIISGTAQLLAQRLEIADLDRERMIKELNKIESTTDRIARIIRGLRSFARQGDRDPFEWISLRRLIEDTLGLCQEKFRIHHVGLKLAMEGDYEIYCRDVQLEQVLLNLLGNAFDAIEPLPERWVEIRVRVHGQRLRIEVVDSGRGISAELASRIMEPFFTTKSVGKGTGLGLSISKGIVEDHGGQIFADTSAVHTTFVVELSKFRAAATPLAKI